VADITFVPTWSGFLFLAAVIDVFSRRVVGWSMSARQRTELVTRALQMAVIRRRPDRVVVHHGDQGCQPRFKGPRNTALSGRA
jgi:putative transposase